MFDYSFIKDQILDAVYGYESDFDIDGIIDELRDMGVRDVDDIDTDEWHDLLMRHDVSGK